MPIGSLVLMPRELEIENFKPTPYGVVYAIFEKDRQSFKAWLQLQQSEVLKTRFDEEDTAWQRGADTSC